MDIKDIELPHFFDGDSAVADIETVVNTPASQGRVAIIGMDCKIGEANSANAFWDLLRDGKTALRDLPQERSKDVVEYLRLRNALHSIPESHYLREAFLEEIDKFDYRFFGLAKQEANLMDPNQRLFLESAWAALEDAGYGGDNIKHTQTGVFVGFSSDFGEDYRHLIHVHAPDAPEISVAGNIRSIIASRIAYHLDLTGPSMMIDTACSSGLVAIHQACRALRNNECEMALVGAVKIDLIPIQEDPATGIGTKDIQDTIAADGLTRTFDDNCAGTSACEGVISFVLKPLERAEQDGDQIYAVICGSAINQDGFSVGITAPNSAAQEQLIVQALADAQLNPEDVSYIEAHGTATRLGDPIEVSGIQRAFRQFTDRKQFCGIGSVKSNLGHMDNAAGLAGLAKVVLAMKHRQLPASLHFNLPNRKIAFEKSPLYVNDKYCEWNSVDNKPLTAGINSFGLSGTNCHVVLQSYNTHQVSQPDNHQTSSSTRAPYFLFLSARTTAALQALALRYLEFFKTESPSLANLAFTASVGRAHHKCRLALVFHNQQEIEAALNAFVQAPDEKSSLFVTGKFTLIADGQAFKEGQLTESQQRMLSQQASELAQRFTDEKNNVAGGRSVQDLQRACELYVAGAQLIWSEWFTFSECRRISLPVYPFARERCWVETTRAGETHALQRGAGKTFAHPLLDQLIVESYGVAIYRVKLSAKTHWELAEHKVKDAYVLPGTCYVEMMLEIARQHAANNIGEVYFDSILFLSPFAVVEGETKEIHIQLTGEAGRYSVKVLSKHSDADTSWDIHVEAKLRINQAHSSVNAQPLVIDNLLQQLPKAIAFSRQDDESRGLVIGDRWNHAFVRGWCNENSSEFMVHLCLPDIYAGEEQHYLYHPSLLDTAVNAVNHLIGDGGLYLPFSYSQFEVHDRLPREFFVRLRSFENNHLDKNGLEKNKQEKNNLELFRFDVELLSMDGNIIGHIHEYTIKRVPDQQMFGNAQESVANAYALTLIEDTASQLFEENNFPQKPLLVIHDGSDVQQQWLTQLRGLSSQTLFDINTGLLFTDNNDEQQTRYQHALHQLGDTVFGAVIFTAFLGTSPIESANKNLLRFMLWINTLVKERIIIEGKCVLLCSQAYAARNNNIQPASTALAGFARVAGLENPQLHLRVVDVDLTVVDSESPQGKFLTDVIRKEIADTQVRDLSIYQHGQRWVQQLAAVNFSETKTPVFDKAGAYVISGGAGALGLELALSLANKGVKNIALLGSTALPDSSAWPSLLADQTLTPKEQNRFEKLQQLKSLGVNLFYHCVDIANKNSLASCLDEIRKNCGAIAGVVHAAGRAGAGFMMNKTTAQLNAVVDPKLVGAWNLHLLTQQDSLAFFVLYSSIATVLLNPGQSDYTAANSFLDGLAIMRRAQGLPALSVCWPAWRETGIAVEHGAVDEAEFFTPIDTSSALTRLSAALTSVNNIPPVVVLADIHSQAQSQDLASLSIQVAPALAKRMDMRKKNQSQQNTDVLRDVAVKGIDVPDEYDHLVAQVWGKILGAHELEADESFNDVGGNSILTTQKYREYERLHPGVIEMADLFTHTTVRAQAEYFRKVLSKISTSPKVSTPSTLSVKSVDTKTVSVGDDELDSILAKLASGELSAEEAESIL